MGDFIQAGGVPGERGDLFGSPVLVKGNFLFVGASGHGGNQGAVFVFGRDTHAWFEKQKLVSSKVSTPQLATGNKFAVDDRVTKLIVPASGRFPSAVFVFERNATMWHEKQTILQPGVHANQGFGLDIVMECGTLAVAATSNVKECFCFKMECVLVDVVNGKYFQLITMFSTFSPSIFPPCGESHPVGKTTV